MPRRTTKLATAPRICTSTKTKAIAMAELEAKAGAAAGPLLRRLRSPVSRGARFAYSADDHNRVAPAYSAAITIASTPPCVPAPFLLTISISSRPYLATCGQGMPDPFPTISARRRRPRARVRAHRGRVRAGRVLGRGAV